MMRILRHERITSVYNYKVLDVDFLVLCTTVVRDYRNQVGVHFAVEDIPMSTMPRIPGTRPSGSYR